MICRIGSSHESKHGTESEEGGSSFGVVLFRVGNIEELRLYCIMRTASESGKSKQERKRNVSKAFLVSEKEKIEYSNTEQASTYKAVYTQNFSKH